MGFLLACVGVHPLKECKQRLRPCAPFGFVGTGGNGRGRLIHLAVSWLPSVTRPHCKQVLKIVVVGIAPTEAGNLQSRLL